MNRKYLITIYFFVLISVVSLVLAFQYLQKQANLHTPGSYAFANTKKNLFNLSRIKLITSDEREMNFYYDSGIWYFEEAADYYVNDQTLKDFYEVVQNSIITGKSSKGISANNQLNIKTYSVDNILLDDVYFSGDDYSLINYANENQVYDVSHTEKLSANPEDWLPSPLFEISTDLISAINFNGKYAKRKTLDETMQFSDDFLKLLSVLERVEYEGIMPKELFEKEYSPIETKTLKIYLRGGLNYVLLISHDSENYYLQILPQRELLARSEVNKIIQIKQMYYDEWTFILVPEQGKILFKADKMVD